MSVEPDFMQKRKFLKNKQSFQIESGKISVGRVDADAPCDGEVYTVRWF